MAYVFYIPNGPKNLKPLFPDINFSEVEEYYIEVLDEDNDVVATSTMNKTGCCCSDEKLRVHFLNYLGTFDAVNFHNKTVTHKPKSETYRRGLPNVLSKTDSGIERNNVTANDTKNGINVCYDEAAQEWLQELADSPKAFEEWSALQNQTDSYLPIVITDTDFTKVKSEDQFRYVFAIEYIMSNDKIILRN